MSETPKQHPEPTPSKFTSLSFVNPDALLDPFYLLPGDDQESVENDWEILQKLSPDEQKRAFQYLAAASLLVGNELQNALQERDVDKLTGLHTKSAWVQQLKDRVADHESRGSNFGFMMLDLNYLKEVNDTSGHDKGDLLISSMGGVLGAQVRRRGDYTTEDPSRPVDFAARLGGDEFGLIIDLSDFTDSSSMEELLITIADRVRTLYGQKVKELALPATEKLSVAIGYAIYDKKIGVSNGLREADMIMSAEKARQHSEHGNSR